MFVEALPAGIDASASGLAGIGAAVAAGNAAGAAPTLGVVPPAPEPASVLLAAAFGTHAGVYQATKPSGRSSTRCSSRPWASARPTTPPPRSSTPLRWSRSSPRVSAHSHGLRAAT